MRDKLFSLRSYTPLPFLIVGLVLGFPTILSLTIGTLMALLGLSVRFWAVGHAHYETRATGSVGAPRLVTSGPFGYARNPLYISNIVMYTGFAVMANIPWLIAATAIWFIFQYIMIVSREEEFLEKEFGAEYEDYRKNVPAFIPRLRSWKNNTREQINRQIAWKSERRTRQAFIIALLLMSAKYSAHLLGWL